MMSQATSKYEDWDHECGIGDIYEWDIFLCPVCHKITLEQKYYFSEDRDQYGYPICYFSHLYPHINMDTSKIPVNLKKAFESALSVRHIDGAICALSLRRTLEMMCKDQGETSGDLYDKLNNLSRRNIMPPVLTEMATILRRLGNTAAHADDAEFSPDIVNSMIDFTQTILDYVYVLPDKLESIQWRLSKEAQVSDHALVKMEEHAEVMKQG